MCRNSVGCNEFGKSGKDLSATMLPDSFPKHLPRFPPSYTYCTTRAATAEAVGLVGAKRKTSATAADCEIDGVDRAMRRKVRVAAHSESLHMDLGRIETAALESTSSSSSSLSSSSSSGSQTLAPPPLPESAYLEADAKSGDARVSMMDQFRGVQVIGELSKEKKILLGMPLSGASTAYSSATDQ